MCMSPTVCKQRFYNCVSYLRNTNSVVYYENVFYVSAAFCGNLDVLSWDISHVYSCALYVHKDHKAHSHEVEISKGSLFTIHQRDCLDCHFFILSKRRTDLSLKENIAIGEEDGPLSEIAEKYEVHRNTVTNCRKMLSENKKLALEPHFFWFS